MPETLRFGDNDGPTPSLGSMGMNGSNNYRHFRREQEARSLPNPSIAVEEPNGIPGRETVSGRAC